MKVLIVFSGLLALTFAGYAQHYPINIPVIGKTGVPLESAEIVHARHAHLSHVAAVRSHQGSGLGWGYGGSNYAGLNYAGSNYAGSNYAGSNYAGAHYAGGYALPVIGHGGVPIDTPEVQHARAAHFAAYAKAASAASYGGDHYRQRRSVYGGYALPVIGHGGVPIDTPEVQHARAAHFAAHAKAGSGLGGLYGGHNGAYGGAYLGGHYGGYEAHTYPKLAHDGQPIETHEVQALKHKHFAAHAEALSRVGNGYGSWGAWGNNGGAESYSNQNLAGYGAGYGYGKYHGGIHIPVIGPKGVPIDTPEVQHARQQHFAALAKASSHGSWNGLDGQYY